jgi:hypothetical protein
MSKIEVDNVVPQSGTNINLGESGDTVTVPTGVTLDTSNSTVTLPDGSVTNAKLANSAITINGSSVSLGGSTTIETGTSWQSSIVTGSTLTAVAGNGYWIDTTSNTCTITLPSSANVGDQLIFSDYARTWGTNKIIIDSNGLNYQGDPDTSTVEYNTNGQSVNIVYSGATKGWIPVSDDDVTDAPIVPPYSVDFLVIAGGGGSRSGDYATGAGGSGAGGYRNSFSTETSGGGGSSEASLTFDVGTVYTVTVGAGGAIATSGGNSSISGTGITTITSTGGDVGGGYLQGDPTSGGSGGGGSHVAQSGAAGTANQGFAGGSNVSENSRTGSGGGGASQVGANNTSTAGGNGGDGLASSITGSSITRGGGGGGGVIDLGATRTVGSGGNGGGGNGGKSDSDGSNVVNPTAGAANTGGGAGGPTGNTTAPGTTGGKGVVILRMPDGAYSGTTTGSPTVTTGVGGTDTVIVFNDSGSYTG